MTAFRPSRRPERVLVTGGAGFIGSHVVDRYLAEGCEVTVVDDLSTGRRERVPSAAEFVELRLDDPRLDDVFAEGRFDTVNHHAAQIDVRRSVTDPLIDAQTNIIGLLNLLERARIHDVARVVYVSSGGVVYGEPETIPTPEGYPKLPLSPYGVGKLAGEYYLAYYREVQGLDAVSLRYSNVYGPRQDPHGEAGVVAIFGLRILADEPITIFGDGQQERDYVYVEDVAEANWLASVVDAGTESGLDARAWNIGTGRGTSVNELADRLMRIADRVVERRPAPERPGELRMSVLDCSKAETELGWSARTGLDDGLARTMEHLATENR